MKEHDFLKYLKRNPGENIGELSDFSHAVIIPAYDEERNLPLLLESLNCTDIPCPVAVIIVVNYPAGASPQSSLALYQTLQNTRLDGGLKLFALFAPELTGGVGEARKIGFDLFCRSRNCRNADSSVMFSLDADCLVDKNYFCETLELASPDDTGCVIIGVKHQKSDDPAISQAITLYENYLLDYEKNLAACNSPYAYNAIGSGFAVKVRDYIRCGGMKLKKAGEDFYFIQSAAKCSQIVKTTRPLVFPSPRLSERVPFGTGTAVRDIIAGTMPRQVTHESFSKLKNVLETIVLTGALDNGENFISLLAPDEAEFFIENGFLSAWQKILANQKPSTEKEKQCAFHLWFDALQTRRFLHKMSGR